MSRSAACRTKIPVRSQRNEHQQTRGSNRTRNKKLLLIALNCFHFSSFLADFWTVLCHFWTKQNPDMGFIYALCNSLRTNWGAAPWIANIWGCPFSPKSWKPVQNGLLFVKQRQYFLFSYVRVIGTQAVVGKNVCFRCAKWMARQRFS